MSENQVKIVYLSLGSNLGDKKLNLEKAKFLLSENTQINIIKSSSYYRTESWPDKKKPFFLNLILEINTFYSPKELFYFIKKIEKNLGRKKGPKNSPRECDIDILDYNKKRISLQLKKEKLIIPHPRLHKRNFVLLPLFEICRYWKHPIFRMNIIELLSSLKLDNIRSIKIL